MVAYGRKVRTLRALSLTVAGVQLKTRLNLSDGTATVVQVGTALGTVEREAVAASRVLLERRIARFYPGLVIK